MKNAIIVDIDGTLAFVGDRSFFDATKSDVLDTINTPVAETIYLFKNAGYRIIFITGSTEDSRGARQRFIKQHLDWTDKIDYDLHMRKMGDYRKDTIFKHEIFDNFIKDKYKVSFVLEDRNQMVDFYRNELKIPCFQVNPEMGKQKKKNKS